MTPEKLEVIYYEMLKLEQRITEKAEVVLNAREDILGALNRFEILQKQLLDKMEKQ